MRHYTSLKVMHRLANIGITNCWSHDLDLDETIDAFRRKFNIVIYNTAPPFVDPCTKGNKIVYSYTVKQCYPGDSNGWNKRSLIGRTKWHSNIYRAKREAISIALKYVERRQRDKDRR